MPMAQTRSRGGKGRALHGSNPKLNQHSPVAHSKKLVSEFHSYAQAAGSSVTPIKTSTVVTKTPVSTSEAGSGTMPGAGSTEIVVSEELIMVPTEPPPLADVHLDVGSGPTTETVEVTTIHTQPSLSEILKEIKACREDMRACRADLAIKIEENKKCINDLKENSEFFFAELKDVQAKAKANENDVALHEARIQFLEDKLNATESHSRRMNLRLYGLPEEEGENLKRRVGEICHAVAPDMGDSLQFLIDVCHRIGRKEDKKTRPVIIRFLSFSARRHIWSLSKTAEILKTRDLRFQEDFTTRDREARLRLWPQIQEARKKNLRAYYVGPKGYIEGKEIKPK